MEMKELEKSILKYNTSSDSEKKEMEKEINNLWREMSELYRLVCEQDEEYMKAFSDMCDINYILDFNMVEAYSDYIEGYQGNEDFSMNDLVSEFQEDKYNEHKYIAENLENLNQELTEKINKLHKKRFVRNKDIQIKRLEETIKYNNECAEYYNKCLNREKTKQEYLKNCDTLIVPVEKRYKDVLKKYAKSIVKKTVERNPIIICEKHTGRWGALNSVQGNILNEVFNELRDTVYQNLNIEVNKAIKR